MVRFIRFALICTAGAGLAGLAPVASAAVYCVDSTTQLQSALTTAASSPDDDDIRLRAGTYQHSLALEYYGAHPDSLTLSSGWITANGDPCGMQLRDARATRLDGADNHQILRLEAFGDGQPGQSVRFSVSNLHFDNAFGQGFIYGGAMHMKNMTSLPGHFSVDNVIFTGNKALHGGALHVYQYQPESSLRIVNSLFDDNTSSTRDMGHLYLIMGGEGSQTFIVNSTFARGRCAPDSVERRCGGVIETGPDSHLAIRSSLFWDTESNDLHVPGSAPGRTLIIDSSLIQLESGTQPTLLAPLGGDPRFVDAAAGDLRLRDDSPFINRGSLASTPGGLFVDDVHGNPRVALGRIDPGALENQTSDIVFADGFQ